MPWLVKKWIAVYPTCRSSQDTILDRALLVGMQVEKKKPRRFRQTHCKPKRSAEKVVERG
jgi:hypothetical protein